MTDPRAIVFDATFMILYIGLFAAMATLSLMLVALIALGIELGPVQAGAAAVNLAGWALMPLAPRLYQRLVGHRFSWRTNGALGSDAEA